MHDIPDPESFLQQPEAHHINGKSRRRVEPIPALDAADSVTVQIELLKETYDEILQAMANNEWEHDEGLRTVLLTGLGYLDGKMRLEQIERGYLSGDREGARRVDALANDLAAYHSMYSVMKFKAFKLYKVNQVLEFNVSGLKATERMWEGWADRMRRQHAELQSEVLRLRALMSEFKIDWDPSQSPLVTAALLLAQRADEVDREPEPEPEPPLQLDEPLLPPRVSLWKRISAFFRGS
jgi:hypothetical protein